MKELSLDDMTAIVAQLKAAATNGSNDPDPVIGKALAVTTSLTEKLLDQQQRIAQLERLVETDELTGLANRRGFLRRVEQAMAEAGRSGAGGLLIYIDLDGFKQVNDTHGHAAGDAVLIQAASLLKAKCRTADTVARLGGDEFAILMPQTEWANGWALARALEHLINQSHADWRTEKLPIRASIGYVAYNGDEQADHVLAAADREMYKRKSRRATHRRSAMA